MNLPAEVTGFDQVEAGGCPIHLAIGIFDGVHLGHQAVIDTALRLAHGRHGIASVLTFDPHPSTLFRPDQPTRLLMPTDVKVRFLHGLGVDLVIRKRFDAEFARIEAGHFLAALRERLPTLASIHVGENFQFGRGRAGDVQVLVESGRELGIGVYSVERMRRNGAPISSTRIRHELEKGEIGTVSDLLGYTYFAEGIVKPGRRQGRELGFPTLNMAWRPELHPPFGVYLVRAARAGEDPQEQGFPAVANYGIRPTVADAGDPGPWLEVHSLRAEKPGAGPGDRLRVEWLEFVRPEQKFGSLDELRQQIGRDVERARNFFGEARSAERPK